ncbi:hypothetical protein HW115_10785 [Verrucomicrobiaceae bacterium N1E253]|uniref:Uncharacterized protein n=1 Tax=Oceaniferula marina TaxID=2748318 RepID=A0A851GFA1_9BACT|nr:hypothetical protein [Oceaniferula marina]NWK56096.1 hypothetical protein [Oceaniferula marina]
MNYTRIIIPSAWGVSLVAAFLIGGQSKQSSNDSDDSGSQSQGQSYSSTSSGGSGNSLAEIRKRSHSRNSAKSSSAKSFEIGDIASNIDPVSRTSDLLKLINTLGPNDFQQVVADFRALDMTRERMSEYAMLLHAWAKVDPVGALDYAEQNTGTPFARQTILASWASDDPESAIVWAKEHHEGDRANPWLVGVIRGIASTDPKRATEVMHELPFSRERGEALGSIVPYIAKQGHDQALLWLDTIKDEKLLNGATAYMASNLAKSDPKTTADWVSTLDDNEAKHRAVREVAEQWEDQDLSSAIAWANTLDGNSKTQAANELIGDYARENPAEAANWLQSMNNEPGYQSTLRSYIWSTSRSHPEFSLAQVSEIPDARSQERYYERILSRWKQQDAEAASSWINNNPVPDTVLKRLNR